MKREFIELTEHQVRMLVDECYYEEDGYIEDDDIGFKFIQEDTNYSDMEKSYKDIKVIIQDNVSNRFYSFNYIDSTYMSFEESNDFYPIKAYEVFPKEITITIYE